MNTNVTKEVNNQKFEDLLKETHETLAENLAQEMLEGKVKQFSVVDLWKLEKNQRSTMNLRKWLN
jgi:hypothetical protein